MHSNSTMSIINLGKFRREKEKRDEWDHEVLLSQLHTYIEDAAEKSHVHYGNQGIGPVEVSVHQEAKAAKIIVKGKNPPADTNPVLAIIDIDFDAKTVEIELAQEKDFKKGTVSYDNILNEIHGVLQKLTRQNYVATGPAVHDVDDFKRKRFVTDAVEALKAAIKENKVQVRSRSPMLWIPDMEVIVNEDNRSTTITVRSEHLPPDLRPDIATLALDHKNKKMILIAPQEKKLFQTDYEWLEENAYVDFAKIISRLTKETTGTKA